MTKSSTHPISPEKFHIDKRAGAIIAAANGSADDLLSTREIAEWLGVSTQWVEIGRLRHYGPRFTRLTPRLIRYRRRDVIDWLEARTHRSTAEYCRRQVRDAL